MITVKVSTSCPKWDWLRQSPNLDGIWENYQFVFDQHLTNCDFWIVYENILQQETTTCSRQNIFLITGEPEGVKTYHQQFLNQFGTIITSQKTIQHPKVVLSHLSLPWMIGYQPPLSEFTKSYSELTTMDRIQKTKNCSVICSNKSFTTGHKLRLNFVRSLKKYFGNSIDFFGRDFNPIQDKWNAIAPYKYHITIENSFANHYWTEKISDAFLGQSHPIYYGCPNLASYFPTNSFTTIDITKPIDAFEIIKNIIESDIYEKYWEAQISAKKLILDRYNFFPRMTQLLSKYSSNEAPQSIILRPHDYFYSHDPIPQKMFRKIKYFIFQPW